MDLISGVSTFVSALTFVSVSGSLATEVIPNLVLVAKSYLTGASTTILMESKRLSVIYSVRSFTFFSKLVVYLLLKLLPRRDALPLLKVMS